MRRPRLYLNAPLHQGARLTLSQPQAHYLTRVLRLGEGAELILFNGSAGLEWRAQLLPGKKITEVAVGEEMIHDADAGAEIHLLQALSKPEHLDWVLQKGTELGVTHFNLFFSERSQRMPNAAQWQKRLVHWQGVVSSACEQCGRSALPGLNHFESLSSLLSDLPVNTPNRYLLDFVGSSCRHLSLESQSPVMLVCGAEGGLTETEIAQLKAAQFQSWCLGARILRTETAALTAIAQLQCLLIDA